MGENGSGKTTLMNWCIDWVTKKYGSLIRVGYIKQDISSVSKDQNSVLEHLIGQDTYRLDLLKQKAAIEKLLYSEESNEDVSDDDLDVEYESNLLTQIENDLRDHKSDTANKRAKEILKGLGFNCKTKISELSGGWIMRLQLAKLLYLKLDFILLDEPTNHLDVDAIEWLENYLLKLNSATLIIISHDRKFLDTVCERFLLIDSKTRKLVSLNNLEIETKIDPKKKSLFDFNDDIKYGYYEIQLHNIAFGYDSKSILFSDIDLCLDTKSKIGILGANGTGKSTLLKIITQELKPNTGVVKSNRKLRIFRLHQIVSVNDSTAIEFILNLDSKLKLQDARMFLGKAGLNGKLHSQKISTLSGGQKSRLMIAKILVLKPHILLLDEPTNHLDLEGTSILLEAIKIFNGGIVIVSHDRHFVYELCDIIYEIKDHKLGIRDRKL